MSIQFQSSVIVSRNIDKLVSFYRNVMQQEIKFDFGGCVIFKCGLSIWNPADGHAVERHMENKSNGSGPFELCFETDDFDQVMETLRKHNVSFLHDVQMETWGQYAARFFDPEQNLVELGESIPCFVRRLHSEGNSLEEVARKTSVPLDTVIQICKKGQQDTKEVEG